MVSRSRLEKRKQRIRFSHGNRWRFNTKTRWDIYLVEELKTRTCSHTHRTRARTHSRARCKPHTRSFTHTHWCTSRILKWSSKLTDRFKHKYKLRWCLAQILAIIITPKIDGNMASNYTFYIVKSKLMKWPRQKIVDFRVTLMYELPFECKTEIRWMSLHKNIGANLHCDFDLWNSRSERKPTTNLSGFLTYYSLSLSIQSFTKHDDERTFVQTDAFVFQVI